MSRKKEVEEWIKKISAAEKKYANYFQRYWFDLRQSFALRRYVYSLEPID